MHMPCIGPKAEETDTIQFGKPICNPLSTKSHNGFGFFKSK
jgi:hypothetical protein